MKQNELGKISIHDFFDQVVEADDILDAIKKERKESKLDLDVLEQRKELLKKLTQNKGE